MNKRAINCLTGPSKPYFHETESLFHIMFIVQRIVCGISILVKAHRVRSISGVSVDVIHIPLLSFFSSFSGNPLLCDCPLKKLYQNVDYISKYEDIDDVICANDPDKANVKTYLTALNCGKAHISKYFIINPQMSLTKSE